MILDLASISKGKDSDPFWKDVCEERVSELWFPTKTDLAEWDLNSYSGSSNEQEALSKYWIKRKLNKNSITTTLSRSSLSSVTPITESVTQVVTKKIRIYPDNIDRYISLCDLSRACYNKMIAFKRDYVNDKRSFQEHRTEIMEETKGWYNYQSHVMQEACRNADITAKAVIKSRIKGKKCDFSFRTFKDSVQGFDIQKLSSNGKIYPRYLGEVHLTENLPEYAKGRTARVITENGGWWLCCFDTVEIPVTTELRKVCALDCGVRTFQTVYSTSEVTELGTDYFKDKLLPLYLKLDKLLSGKKKQQNLKLDNQRSKDLITFYDKKINKLRSRIKNLVEDLHKKCANYLTNEFDVILLPTFETRKMSKFGNRKINNKSVRAMLGLSHYKFKMLLKWFALKKGKVVLDVNESFTSKTNPFTGMLMDIGSSKTFKYQDAVYDRDINGARNIFIKNTLRCNEEWDAL